MHRFLIIFATFLCFSPAVIFSNDILYDESEEEVEKEPKRDASELLGLPESTKIIYTNASDYIREGKKKHQLMGVSDENCDNTTFALEVDFDPFNQTLLELNSKCLESQNYPIDQSIAPLLTKVKIPRHYMPIHRCMQTQITYHGRIPLIGPHRPLWAYYGEYAYVPPQRWLHNVEHGAIIALYHPCADPKEVEQLKALVKSCLFRHIITPYTNLTRERPMALIGWAGSLEFARYDYEMTKGFIRYYAKTGPERLWRNGQYKHLLLDQAKVITNVRDDNVCQEA
ncbi:hypothetical protein PVAND_013768 [Polypedilum vanderplanki]|uniref:DUF3105 domain-containing protein n=1 Tax=Polypedilum vanderplanki TaxID=319348 RepID=A0A9J6CSB7_POLVA|nr:hypothetical protein PVAND_013768 [Polypedilum vanderplanki]